jgi:hypothetical protein
MGWGKFSWEMHNELKHHVFLGELLPNRAKVPWRTWGNHVFLRELVPICPLKANVFLGNLGPFASNSHVLFLCALENHVSLWELGPTTPNWQLSSSLFFLRWKKSRTWNWLEKNWTLKLTLIQKVFNH